MAHFRTQSLLPQPENLVLLAAGPNWESCTFNTTGTVFLNYFTTAINIDDKELHVQYGNINNHVAVEQWKGESTTVAAAGPVKSLSLSSFNSPSAWPRQMFLGQEGKSDSRTMHADAYCTFYWMHIPASAECWGWMLSSCTDGSAGTSVSLSTFHPLSARQKHQQSAPMNYQMVMQLCPCNSAFELTFSRLLMKSSGRPADWQKECITVVDTAALQVVRNLSSKWDRSTGVAHLENLKLTQFILGELQAGVLFVQIFVEINAQVTHSLLDCLDLILGTWKQVEACNYNNESLLNRFRTLKASFGHNYVGEGVRTIPFAQFDQALQNTLSLRGRRGQIFVLVGGNLQQKVVH